MSSLFLLDRGTHSISFAENPDPTSTIWLEFQMLSLPLLKFGTINSIPSDELIYYIKNDISEALRAIYKIDPDVIVSSGRACLVHCELIESKEWSGKNVFIDFPDSTWSIPSRALKKKSIFLSSHENEEKRMSLRPPKKAVPSQDDLMTTIDAARIDRYVQDHFF